ncbi:MAG: arginine repressor [Bacteroidetes bacterium]|nr:arginine repressor [Bacteroidota bacterium]
MEKQNRQLAIKQIIAEHTITTQEELGQALKRQGFKITQATLSRDMKELGISWVYTPSGSRYMLHTEAEEQRLLIIVKTLPGRAQGVAELIDAMRHPSVLGTIAGDNTIFIAPRSTKKIPETMKLIRNLVTGS